MLGQKCWAKNAGPKMLGHKCWAKNAGICCVEVLLAFARGFSRTNLQSMKSDCKKEVKSILLWRQYNANPLKYKVTEGGSGGGGG